MKEAVEMKALKAAAAAAAQELLLVSLSPTNPIREY